MSRFIYAELAQVPPMRELIEALHCVNDKPIESVNLAHPFLRDEIKLVGFDGERELVFEIRDDHALRFLTIDDTHVDLVPVYRHFDFNHWQIVAWYSND